MKIKLTDLKKFEEKVFESLEEEYLTSLETNIDKIYNLVKKASDAKKDLTPQEKELIILLSGIFKEDAIKLNKLLQIDEDKT